MWTAYERPRIVVASEKMGSVWLRDDAMGSLVV